MTGSTAAIQVSKETLVQGGRTLQRYLAEEKRALTLKRARERVESETIALDPDDLEAVIDSDAVTTTTTGAGETQVTAVDLPDDAGSDAGSEPDGYASQVDGYSGNYGGIDMDFEATGDATANAASMPDTTADVSADDLTDLGQVGDARAEALREAGFGDYPSIQSASLDALSGVDGITEDLGESIRDDADGLCNPLGQIAVSAYNNRQADAADDGLDLPTHARVKKANEVNIPAGDYIAPSEAALRNDEDEEYHYMGMPILEKTANPFIPDVSSLEPFKKRKLDTGEDAWRVVAKLIGQGNAVGLSGYPAVGKDTLAEYVCARTNSPVLRLPADGTMLAKDLFGTRTTDGDGNVVWVNGPVPTCVEQGWKLVIDEINSLDPSVALALNRLLEDDGYLYLRDQNRVIEPHPEFSLIATKNPAEASFKGTHEMNEAFKSRLTWLDIPYLPTQKEAELVDAKINADHRVFTKEQVLDLVELANDFRDAASNNEGLPRLSTRHLIKAGDLARAAPDKTGAIREIVRGACGPRDRQESALELVAGLDTFDH